MGKIEASSQGSLDGTGNYHLVHTAAEQRLLGIVDEFSTVETYGIKYLESIISRLAVHQNGLDAKNTGRIIISKFMQDNGLWLTQKYSYVSEFFSRGFSSSDPEHIELYWETVHRIAYTPYEDVENTTQLTFEEWKLLQTASGKFLREDSSIDYMSVFVAVDKKLIKTVVEKPESALWVSDLEKEIHNTVSDSSSRTTAATSLTGTLFSYENILYGFPESTILVYRSKYADFETSRWFHEKLLLPHGVDFLNNLTPETIGFYFPGIGKKGCGYIHTTLERLGLRQRN